MVTRITISRVAGCIAVCVLFGCTQPGEMTGIGAAAGGVLGAGLGAIVGNQTGNPGSGLAIGAAAGAGAGAMIANAFEAQQETLRSQDEAIERQEQLIRAQKSELEELRRLNQNSDNSSARRTGKRYSMLTTSPSKSTATKAAARSASQPSSSAVSGISMAKKRGLEEKKQQADISSEPLSSERGAYNWNKNETQPKQGESIAATLTSTSPASSECTQARSEVQRAREVTESAEKLFHLRRALRMCPDNPDYHNQLGELYFSLNRKDDAEYEYNEALRLSPSNREARANLEYVRSK